MNHLDDVKRLSSGGYGRMLDTVVAYPKQFRAAWDAVTVLRLPASYRKVKNVVFSGMGGSGLGLHMAQVFTQSTLKIPCVIVNDYHLPAFVGKDALVIVSSYSGNPEETLAAAKEAVRRRAKVFGITTGGKLARFLHEARVPTYHYDPVHDPADAPRMAVGYTFFALLSLFNALGFVSLSKSDIKAAVNGASAAIKRFGPTRPQKKNDAKEAAAFLYGKAGIFVCAAPLIGSTHALVNQINENSKHFVAYFVLPELNHHLLEGLGNPTALKKNSAFIFIDSSHYFSRTRRRLDLTEALVRKAGLQTRRQTMGAKHLLAQIAELMVWGSYVSIYLAALNHVDPVAIVWVDYFKKQLAAK